MNRYIHYLSVLALSAILLVACEGPMGPNGQDGQDGQDANETCKKCHNDQTDLVSKFAQAKLSMHQSGTAWFEGTRTSCAPCHSNEGFNDVVMNQTSYKAYNASASVTANPSPIGCNTCHKIHTAYDSTDFDLRFTDAIDMLIDTASLKTINLGAGNSSQLCMKCHQPRLVKTIDYAGAPTSNYTGITSFRWGVHYGTVGAIFAGKGGFELGTGYANSDHTTKTECKSCHMAAQSGMAGGHTFFALDEESGKINTNGCNVSGCHASQITAKTFDAKVKAVQDTIQKYIEMLGAKIDEIGGTTGGILQMDGNEYTGYLDIYNSSNPTGKWKMAGSSGSLPEFPTISNTQAAAIANLQLVLREKSKGVHNYLYTLTLLKNSIAAL